MKLKTGNLGKRSRGSLISYTVFLFIDFPPVSIRGLVHCILVILNINSIIYSNRVSGIIARCEYFALFVCNLKLY